MNYTLQLERGRGGFGIVYEAEGEDGNIYALKTLNLATVSPNDQPTLKRRFEREVRYQQQVPHPNVVPILEHNIDADPPFFVMPLAICSLADDLIADRTLGGDPKGPLFDILAGLEALHNAGLRHRDLKPANVLKYQNPDGSFSYKISDFGLTTPGAGQTSTLTGSNMAGGTPLYRPPECANNFRRATAQADIYSFGCILHDIFGGGVQRVPHSKLTVTGPLRDIVEQCTETNARRRFRSVSLLREALFNVLDQSVVEFESQEEEDVISLLNSNDILSDDQWDRAFNLIDDNADKDISNYNIMRALKHSHIEGLLDNSPDMFHGLGEIYADFAHYPAFNFDYCDIVSDKAQIFFDHGDLNLKSKIALAMLTLGTSHNRWLVEHQFVRMVGVGTDTALAQRVRIEILAQGIPFVRMVEHLEASISSPPEKLHPVLHQLFVELSG